MNENCNPSRHCCLLLQALVRDRGPAALTSIENFVVQRDGYGSVMWPGPIDVTALNLEDIVSIGQGEQVADGWGATGAAGWGPGILVV